MPEQTIRDVLNLDYHDDNTLVLHDLNSNPAQETMEKFTEWPYAVASPPEKDDYSHWEQEHPFTNACFVNEYLELARDLSYLVSPSFMTEPLRLIVLISSDSNQATTDPFHSRPLDQ